MVPLRIRSLSGNVIATVLLPLNKPVYNAYFLSKNKIANG